MAAAAGPGPDRVPRVEGGETAEPCAWPTSAAIVYDQYAEWEPESMGVFCSATLVHPELVVFASHCMDPWGNAAPDTIVFGETAEAPGLEAKVTECGAKPWEWQAKSDWAWCRLAEPVDLPVTPILYGCETDLLKAGKEIVASGWGVPELGLKTWGRVEIEKVNADTVVFGTDQLGICGGDSGGSGLLQLEDGSWRAFSIASLLNGSGDCGSITAARLDRAVPWLEEQSGLDLTPCHDVDGTWNPGPGCTQFFAGDETGSGAWDNLCAGTSTSGPSTTCGDPMPDDAPPLVSIVRPLETDTFPDEPSLVAVEIDVDDQDGTGVMQVTLSVEGLALERFDDAAPWGLDPLELPQGVWTLNLVGEDWAGNVGEDSVTITVGQPDSGEEGGEDGDPPPGDDDGGDDEGETTGDPGEVEMDAADAGCGCAAASGPVGAPWWLLGLFFVTGLDRFGRRRR